MKYSIYHKVSGEIIQNCSNSTITSLTSITLPNEYGLLDGNYQSTDYYVNNGVVVEYSDVEKELKKNNASNNVTWSNEALSWVDIRSLGQAKEQKWCEIKAKRENYLLNSLVTPFGTFDATVPAQKSITDAVLMLQTLASLGTPTTIDFTLADNSVVTLSTGEMVTVGLLLGQRTQQVYAQGRVKRDAIDAATTAAEVEAIVW